LFILLAGGCIVQADDDDTQQPGASESASPANDGTDGTAGPPDDSSGGADEDESSSAGGDSSSSSDGSSGTDSRGALSFAGDTLPILAANCSCHRGGAPSAGLDLDDDAAFDSLVDAPSSAAGLDYVEPDDPDASYLVHKLRGSHASVGGGGSRMPLGGELSSADLQTVEDWVSDGALP
jgi:hypothetical protein